MLEAESFWAGVFFCALKNFSAREFLDLELSRGKRTFASGRSISIFECTSAGSVNGTMYGSRDESGFDGAIDGSMVGSMDFPIDDSVAGLFFRSGGFLFLVASTSGRVLSSFAPRSIDGSGAGYFGGSMVGSVDGFLLSVISVSSSIGGSSISSCSCSRCSRRNCRSSSSIDGSSISSRSCSRRYDLYLSSLQLVSVSCL